jgi:hypothetical protein
MQRNSTSRTCTTEEIVGIIRLVPDTDPTQPPLPQRQLRQRLAKAFAAWFEVRMDDPVVPCPISLWRVPESEQYAPVATRPRHVAFGLYRDGHLCGLVDIERRPAPVHSLARAADGRFFRSCKALERLAVAAYAWSRQQRRASPLRSAQLVRELAAIRSDAPAVHNPAGLALVLIVGRPPGDADWLAARLRSLGAATVDRAATGFTPVGQTTVDRAATGFTPVGRQIRSTGKRPRDGRHGSLAAPENPL